MHLNYPGHGSISSDQCENYTPSVNTRAFSENTEEPQGEDGNGKMTIMEITLSGGRDFE